MPSKTRDPLLAIASMVVMAFRLLLAVTTALVTFAIVACLTVARGRLLAALAEAGAPGSAYWGVIALLVLMAGMLVLAMRFLLELRGIIRSVHEADPFRPENADRLSRMGWLMVAAYGSALVAAPLAAWLKAVADKAGGELDFTFGLDGGGILLVLVLFILARVFRKGAEMREELEGTV